MTELEKQIIDAHLDEISNRIDFDVMSSLLVDSCGWTKVDLDKIRYVLNVKKIISWANKNCGKKKYMSFSEKFVFENAEDALIFKLMWS